MHWLEAVIVRVAHMGPLGIVLFMAAYVLAAVTLAPAFLLTFAAGAIFGSQYNVLEQLQLPRVPVDEGSLATGALIALAAILIGTLVASIVGGKAGERYHRKIDRLAYRD